MLNSVDSTSTEQLELAEQCLALVSAIINLDEASLTESLQFILHEKLAALYTVLSANNR
ncbi:hypothetical protein [Budvicia diplopodorum]|uniref:hypothetical protein n=1 Tax=Budvicia diplopodorum TaxID=1119056 RepID=UPI0013578D5B|nr:hypothetical protein [Budvicia diplopodorum]